LPSIDPRLQGSFERVSEYLNTGVETFGQVMAEVEMKRDQDVRLPHSLSPERFAIVAPYLRENARAAEELANLLMCRESRWFSERAR
jgi:hypothetical protein